MALEGGEVLDFECPICYDAQSKPEFSTLLCGHIFHTSCLRDALKRNQECPTCRTPVRPPKSTRWDGGGKRRCPCQTGEPVRLYGLQLSQTGSHAPVDPDRGVPKAAAEAAARAAAAQRAAQREAQLQTALADEQLRSRSLSDREVQATQRETQLRAALQNEQKRVSRLVAADRQAAQRERQLREDLAAKEDRVAELEEEVERLEQRADDFTNLVAMVRMARGDHQHKLPLPVAALTALVSWLAAVQAEEPARAAECAQDMCWLTMGYFGMLRRNELCALRVADVQIGGAIGGVRVFLAQTKGASNGGNDWLYLPPRSGSGFQIERILSRHMAEAVRQGAAPQSPLFTHGAVWTQGVRPLHKGTLTARLGWLLLELQRARPEVGPEAGSLAACSLRMGGLAAARAAGVEEEQLKVFARLPSNILMLMMYRSQEQQSAVVQAI